MTRFRYGDPSELRLTELDRPTPGPGQVLVRVHAAGVDQGVWHLITGRPYPIRPVSGLRRPRNPVPGLDLAGTVEAVGVAVGAGAGTFQPGDEVFGVAVGAGGSAGTGAGDSTDVGGAGARDGVAADGGAGTGTFQPGDEVFGVAVGAGAGDSADVGGGAGAGTFQPGDEVFGTAEGSFAEYVVTDADKLARKPARLSFAEAAAVPTSAYAALQGLRDKGGVRAGQSVLVIGAGGGVGSFGVQLARAFGAEVAGVCSTARVDLVRSLGAARVVDRTREDVTAAGRRYDVVLDCGGQLPLKRLRRLLEPRGALVIVGSENHGGRWLQGTDRQLRAMLLSPFVGQRLGTLISTDRPADLELLRTMLEDGRLTPALDRTYPLDQAAEAIRSLREGRVHGKVALTL